MEFSLPWKKDTKASAKELEAASRKFDLELDLQRRLSARKMGKLEQRLAALPITGKMDPARQLVLGDIKTQKNVIDSMFTSALLVHKLDGAAKTTITKIHAIVAANEISAISANIEQPPGTSLENAMRDHANTARTNNIIAQIDTISTLDDDGDDDDGGESEQLYEMIPSVPNASLARNQDQPQIQMRLPN